MNGAIKLLSQIFKIWEISKNINRNHNFQKTKFSEFKKRIYVKEPCYVYMCTKFQVGVLKITNLPHFKGWNGLFHVVSWDFRIFTIFIFSALGRSKTVGSKVDFFRSWKTDLKHVSRVPNINFLIRPFLDLVTMNDLDLEYTLTESLASYLEVSHDTIHVVVLTYFRFHLGSPPY